ncbi:MAG: hypothetical protein R3D98_17785 [Candidatus Krumholzibacteriia bacterium]
MDQPTVRDRWLGAVCYLSVLVVVPILARQRSEFLARHCRQGFALLFAEVVVGLLVLAVESALGRIPVLGLLVSIVLSLAYWLLFLGISVLGFVKALSGEDFEVAGLEDLAAARPRPRARGRRTILTSPESTTPQRVETLVCGIAA